MYKGSTCDRKSQLSKILTEPLNPRVGYYQRQHRTIAQTKRPETAGTLGLS